MAFELNARLAADCLVIGEFSLCSVLLMNDSRYPWIILVPKVVGAQEIYQLSETNQAQLMKELSFAANTLEALFSADKMNIAALGNIVRQLHIHVVARSVSDATWPGPVWGQGEREPYADSELQALRERLDTAFADWLETSL